MFEQYYNTIATNEIYIEPLKSAFLEVIKNTNPAKKGMALYNKTMEFIITIIFNRLPAKTTDENFNIITKYLNNIAIYDTYFIREINNRCDKYASYIYIMYNLYNIYAKLGGSKLAKVSYVNIIKLRINLQIIQEKNIPIEPTLIETRILRDYRYDDYRGIFIVSDKYFYQPTYFIINEDDSLSLICFGQEYKKNFELHIAQRTLDLCKWKFLIEYNFKIDIGDSLYEDLKYECEEYIFMAAFTELKIFKRINETQYKETKYDLVDRFNEYLNEKHIMMTIYQGTLERKKYYTSDIDKLVIEGIIDNEEAVEIFEFIENYKLPYLDMR